MSREGSSAPSPPLRTTADLLAVFERGGKPRSRFGMGIEFEAVGVQRPSGRAVPFDGDRGIESVLDALADLHGSERVFNGERIIALQHGESAVTLEPGGQVEFSSAVFTQFEPMVAELLEHFDALETIGERKGICFLSLGVQPVSLLREMPWVPKFRYAIMREMYERRGDLSLEMMTRTASIQANFDYENEADARRKVHVGAALGPVVGAMFANSAVEGGGLNGLCSRRLLIWKNTDRIRTGVPPFFVDGTFSFERYAEFAADLPMYFVLREGRYVDRTSVTFRRFLEGAIPGDEATETDWLNHLTTLFPDVRLKGYLEFRTADSVTIPLGIALMAFWRGLLYDPDALGSAVERFGAYSAEDLDRAANSAAHRGLAGSIGGGTLLAAARDAVAIAVEGLSRLDRATGRNDLRWLDPLRTLVDEGLSPAERLRREWDGTIPSLLGQACIRNR